MCLLSGLRRPDSFVYYKVLRNCLGNAKHQSTVECNFELISADLMFRIFDVWMGGGGRGQHNICHCHVRLTKHFQISKIKFAGIQNPRFYRTDS